MPILIPTFLSYLLLIGLAHAQVSAPPCTDDAFSWVGPIPSDAFWTDNVFRIVHGGHFIVVQLAQTKPLLSRSVLSRDFTIPALNPGSSYTGPSGVDDGDQCKCNMVAYNLIGACDACQGESWIPYSEWSTNCTTNATAGTFPKPVPAGTRVPKWAYNNNLTIEGSWNMTLAQLAGDSPEVTGTASIIPTSTSEATPNTSSSLTSSPHHTSNAGAIAGGVVGGIVGAVLIAGFVLWFAFRRRRARSVPSAYMGEKELPPPQNLAELAPKIYDPSDPTTFPSKEYLSLSNEALGSTSHTQPSDGRYTGLPEI